MSTPSQPPINDEGGGSGHWLLVSDVDGTLTGDAAALLRFARVVQASPLLLVALNSSRPLASQDGSLHQWRLPFQPDAMIGAMGTEIRIGQEPLEAWTRRFEGWDRAVVDRLMARLGLEPHAEQYQRPFKASFTVPAERWEEVEAALRATGLPVRIVRSGASDFDVLPPQAGKDHATRFLADHLGVGAGRLVVAGDSANDLAMFEAASKGIVVGNARAELREAVDPRRAYLAREPFAAGVLEGLAHWGVPLASDDRKTPSGELP